MRYSTCRQIYSFIHTLELKLIIFFYAQIASLSEPYGKCEAINPIPVSECQLNCKTEKVLEICGCQDLYMSQSEAVNGKREK